MCHLGVICPSPRKSEKWSKSRKPSKLTGRVVFLKKESNSLFRVNFENFLCQLEYRSLRIKLGDIQPYYVPQNNKKNEVKIIRVIFIAS